MKRILKFRTREKDLTAKTTIELEGAEWVPEEALALLESVTKKVGVELLSWELIEDEEVEVPLEKF